MTAATITQRSTHGSKIFSRNRSSSYVSGPGRRSRSRRLLEFGRIRRPHGTSRNARDAWQHGCARRPPSTLAENRESDRRAKAADPSDLREPAYRAQSGNRTAQSSQRANRGEIYFD